MSHMEQLAHYHHRLWAEKDISAIDEIFAPDAKIHSPIQTTQGTTHMKQIISKWHTGFPDMHVKWIDAIEGGSKMAFQWEAAGHHTGEFLGLPATGKEVTYRGASIYTMQNDQITEYWAYLDMGAILAQISE